MPRKKQGIYRMWQGERHIACDKLSVLAPWRPISDFCVGWNNGNAHVRLSGSNKRELLFIYILFCEVESLFNESLPYCYCEILFYYCYIALTFQLPLFHVYLHYYIFDRYSYIFIHIHPICRKKYFINIVQVILIIVRL